MWWVKMTNYVDDFKLLFVHKCVISKIRGKFYREKCWKPYENIKGCPGAWGFIHGAPWPTGASQARLYPVDQVVESARILSWELFTVLSEQLIFHKRPVFWQIEVLYRGDKKKSNLFGVNLINAGKPSGHDDLEDRVALVVGHRMCPFHTPPHRVGFTHKHVLYLQYSSTGHGLRMHSFVHSWVN